MAKIETDEVGFVSQIYGKVVFLDGLPTAQVGELLEADNGATGYVGGLYEDRVEVYLLSGEEVFPGQMFKRTGKYLELTVGDFILGRVLDPLGRPQDSKVFPTGGQETEVVKLDLPAIGVAGRRFITEQFDTGISVIDTVLPLGKGQRELILGESRSGKSSFLIDVVANQKKQGVICIFGLIGKPIDGSWDVWSRLSEANLMEHTIIVASTSLDPAPLVYLTPLAAMSIASYFQKKGKDVLVILDDMGTHARNYREMSLVSGRPPGRESYPGDIFYQQAKIMERAGCFSKEAGGGSITLLPVIELALSDFTSFIPTNLMGMTDGHLLFKSTLAQQGQRPAIDLFLSVTRVGAQTQNRLQNLLGTEK